MLGTESSPGPKSTKLMLLYLKELLKNKSAQRNISQQLSRSYLLSMKSCYLTAVLLLLCNTPPAEPEYLSTAQPHTRILLCTNDGHTGDYSTVDDYISMEYRGEHLKPTFFFSLM